jgi:hypothetical protein
MSPLHQVSRREPGPSATLGAPAAFPSVPPSPGAGSVAGKAVDAAFGAPAGVLVEVRTRTTGIVGATADGAGSSLPWMTTNGPSFASDLVRPRLGCDTRSRDVSPGSGANDESGTPERSGWSWRVRMGADLAGDGRLSERAGWSWRVRARAARALGDHRPSERSGWSWLPAGAGC